MTRTGFTEEHEAFRQLARSFLEKDVVPHFENWEKEGAPPRDLYSKLGALGIL